VAETTLVAYRTDTGALQTIGDADLALLRELSDARLLACIHCHSALMLKAGTVRLHHFAHVNQAACDYLDHEPESASHRLGKFALYQHFRHGSIEAALERHIPSTDQRADCFVQMPDQGCYALEFQQANNSATRWQERRQLYHRAGLADIWFLGIIRYKPSATEPPRPISTFDPLPVPRHDFEASAGSFLIRDLEKAIIAAEQRLVYLDPETKLLTILLARTLSGNTVRAYRYVLPLAMAELRAGALWTPLDPLLADYAQYQAQRRPGR
jgi:hypothetical protein